MRTIYFFWYTLDWLEFFTYVLIPASIILVILVYIYFNLRLLRFSVNSNYTIQNNIFIEIDEDLFWKQQKEKLSKINYNNTSE